MDSPNKQIRIAAGAIMLRDESGDGLGWKTGITSNGINAKLVNAGQLNTANVSIMHGDEPHFRWDAFGISAYYFESNNSSGYLYGLDTKKGVRFDRFGLYGYNGIDGATWKPKDINEIKDYASFALTWEGLYLTLG
jgi:hypothetical protein